MNTPARRALHISLAGPGCFYLFDQPSCALPIPTAVRAVAHPAVSRSGSQLHASTRPGACACIPAAVSIRLCTGT